MLRKMFCQKISRRKLQEAEWTFKKGPAVGEFLQNGSSESPPWSAPPLIQYGFSWFFFFCVICKSSFVLFMWAKRSNLTVAEVVPLLLELNRAAAKASRTIFAILNAIMSCYTTYF